MMDRLILLGQLIGLLCLGIASDSAAQARMDAMELRLLEPYSLALRWDNVEADVPYWINGTKPDYNDDLDMETVRLAPKQQLTLFLPAYESLRFFHPNQMLDGKELDVYSSDGSGLTLKQAMKPSTDGHSLVFSPNSAAPLLIHIQRACCRAGVVEVGMFVSRKQPLNDLAPYRNFVWSSERWHLLAQDPFPFALPEIYRHLMPRHTQYFAVSGPARIVLKSRLDFERHAVEMLQDYRIKYGFDEKYQQELAISTQVEIHHVITVDGKIEVTGREEQAFIEVPKGRHWLYLQSDRPVYVQLLAQTEHDYLFNSLNNPLRSVKEIRESGLLPGTELTTQAQIATAIAHENNRKAGGLVASNLVRTTALKRPDYPSGVAEADQFVGARTFYRDLLPSTKTDPGDQFSAYFLNETLQPVRLPSRDAVLADQNLVDALKRINQAYFTPLNQQGSAGANEYTLPDQQTESELRLIVDKRQCVPGFLHVEINREFAKDLGIRCRPEVDDDAFVRSVADSVIARLQQQHKNPNITLNPLFSAFAEPGKLIPAAVFEIPLPRHARTIKVWRSSKAEKPVQIAVQYRTAKPFILTEQSHLALMRELPRKELSALLVAQLEHGDNGTSQPPETKSTAEQELINQWQPLKRLLFSEYRLYKSFVAAMPEATADSLFATNNNEADIRLAEAAENQQQWLDALEIWGKIANGATGRERDQARLRQANALNQFGEYYLAEALLRYLTLYGDTDVAEQAVTELAIRYRSQNNSSALLALAASMFVTRPSVEHSKLLSESLMLNGEYRFALVFGLVQPGQLSRESLLTAAYQLQWWESYEKLMEAIPAKQRAFWGGLKAQRFADYNAAFKAWSDFKPWRDYLNQGLQLRELLPHGTAKNTPEFYRQWVDWQQKNPGSRTWEDALWHAKDYAAADTYYAVERDVYSQAVRATQARPVVLKLLGPATLNLLVRPIHHPGQPEESLDGWIQINDNHTQYQYPFLNNVPSQGLQVIGRDQVQVGNLVSLPYRVGQGWHEIKVFSEQAPLSVGVQEQRPELPVSALPPLTADNFTDMDGLNPVLQTSASSKYPANR